MKANTMYGSFDSTLSSSSSKATTPRQATEAGEQRKGGGTPRSSDVEAPVVAGTDARNNISTLCKFHPHLPGFV
jgi:hypothetical protein